MNTVFACIALLAVALAASSERANGDDLPEAVRFKTPLGVVRRLPGAGEGRIVGGSYATKGQIPYQASLIIDDSSLCGGSLIATSWVLTAAHCANNWSRVQVTLGGLSRDLSADEEGRVVVQSKRCIQHEWYSSYSLWNDILLVELENPVTFSDTIQPSKLATNNKNKYVGATARVSGFGRTQTSLPASTALKYVDVKVMDNWDCEDIYGDDIYNGNICTEEIDPKVPGNSCNGDSGGPLVDLESGLQIGIVSFGSANGCESGDPKGLTRVTYFADWISNKTGIAL